MTVLQRYPFLRELVFERSGVLLGDDQEYLLEARLAPIARDLGLDDGAAVVERLRAAPDTPLADRVVEAMVTGETSWFRDRHPFETLQNVVLPRLIQARKAEQALSIWSAACSTGQELYSIAMLLDTYFPEIFDWDLQLLGTDLSATAIARAREGHYSALEVNRGLPASMLARYFSRDGAGYRVSERLRARTRFDTLNLVRDWLPPSSFDIVLLRNVLIYFDIPLKKKVLADVWARVSPRGGVMFLGSTETVLGLTDGLAPPPSPVSTFGATFYEKSEG